MVSGARVRSGGPIVMKSEGLDRTGSGSQAPAVFLCPMPGCNRTFAELWKLRAHYRSPVRTAQGQGGHASELPTCPRCEEDLVPGLPHLGCAGGLAAPRQAAKRRRQQMRRVEGRMCRRAMSLDEPQLGAPPQLAARALSGVDQATFSFLDAQLARFQADPSGPVGQSLLQATSAPAAAGGNTPPELRHLVSAFVQAIMSQQAEQGKDVAMAAGEAMAAVAARAATLPRNSDSSDSCSDKMGSPVVTRASCCGGACCPEPCLGFGSPAPVNSASCAPHPAALSAMCQQPQQQQQQLIQQQDQRQEEPINSFEAFTRAGGFGRVGALKAADPTDEPCTGATLHSLKSENILTPHEWTNSQPVSHMPMAAWPPGSQAPSLSLAPAGLPSGMDDMTRGPSPLLRAAPMHVDDDSRGAPLPLLLQGGWDGRPMSPMPPLCFTPPPATLGPNTNQLPAWWRPSSAAPGQAGIAGLGRQDSLMMLMAAAARGVTPQPSAAAPPAPQHMWHGGCGHEPAPMRGVSNRWSAEPEAWSDSAPTAMLSSMPPARA